MRVYRYKCIPLWILLYVSDCARSQRHSRLFLPNWDTQPYTYSETHTERGGGEGRWRQRWQNQDFLCGLEQCSVYVHCTHDTRTPVSIENTVKENVGAIYCCHQITNFFTQYAPACYICAVIVALLSRAAPRYDTDRPTDRSTNRTSKRINRTGHSKSSERRTQTAVHMYSIGTQSNVLWVSHVDMELLAPFSEKVFGENQVERHSNDVHVFVCVRIPLKVYPSVSVCCGKRRIRMCAWMCVRVFLLIWKNVRFSCISVDCFN